MEKIKTFKEFINESKVNEQSMTINDFSVAFMEFYDYMNKYYKNMDSDTVKHLKEAVKHLDLAWENEADAHGVDFEKYKIKF